MTSPETLTRTSDKALEVRDLVVEFRPSRKRRVRAVDGVSFNIKPGQTVGLVGESGSGKSTIGRAILGLQPVTDGSIRYAGTEITERTQRTRRELARELQVVFQDPFSSLNPSRTVGKTLAEPLEVNGSVARRDVQSLIDGLLGSVGLPGDAADRYPHNFSGGQRQRIAIARALAISPDLVVCDESVSALDLVTRAQVVNLLSRLQRERGLAYLFIAHDLPIVTHMAEWTVVLYRGRVMEQGPAKRIEAAPLHPYTRALLAAVPVPDVAEQRRRRAARHASAVTTTAGTSAPDGNACPFAARCPLAADVCWTARPRRVVHDERELECHAYDPASGHPELQTTEETGSAQ